MRGLHCQRVLLCASTLSGSRLYKQPYLVIGKIPVGPNASNTKYVNVDTELQVVWPAATFTSLKISHHHYGRQSVCDQLETHVSFKSSLCMGPIAALGGLDNMLRFHGHLHCAIQQHGCEE